METYFLVIFLLIATPSIETTSAKILQSEIHKLRRNRQASRVSVTYFSWVIKNSSTDDVEVVLSRLK